MRLVRHSPPSLREAPSLTIEGLGVAYGEPGFGCVEQDEPFDPLNIRPIMLDP